MNDEVQWLRFFLNKGPEGRRKKTRRHHVSDIVSWNAARDREKKKKTTWQFHHAIYTIPLSSCSGTASAPKPSPAMDVGSAVSLETSGCFSVAIKGKWIEELRKDNKVRGNRHKVAASWSPVSCSDRFINRSRSLQPVGWLRNPIYLLIFFSFIIAFKECT